MSDEEIQIEDDLQLARRIDEYAEDLSDWEIDFIESCLRRLEVEGRSLSEKQRNILERMDSKI